MTFKKIQKSVALLLLIVVIAQFFAIPKTARAAPKPPSMLPALAVLGTVGVLATAAVVLSATNVGVGATAATAAVIADSLAKPLSVPVFDAGNVAKHTLTAKTSTVSGAQETVQAPATLWTKIKTFILDTAAKTVFRILLKMVKDMIINAVITGDFGAPTFVQNFQADFANSAQNAARSFISQLTNINFCNFNPNPRPLFISLNFQFRFQCTATRQLYDQYLTSPGSMMLLDRMLATDPSTNLVQSIISVGQTRGEQIAQNLVSRAAQTVSSGFIGNVTSEISAAANSAYKEAVQAEIASCKADFEAANRTDGLPPALTQDQVLACDSAVNSIPRPTPTDTIKTPGQTASGLVSEALGVDVKKNVIYNEFDQALVAIIDTAFGVIVNKGLTEAFK